MGIVQDHDYRVFGAQASGCSPVAVAYEAGLDVVRPVKPKTIAKSLAIGNPADGPYVLDVVRRTGGAVAHVSDEEIVAAMRLLAQTEGIFAETAGGVTLAVLRNNPPIAAAAIYGQDGQLFATYLRQQGQHEPPAQAGPDGIERQEGSVRLFQPIFLEGQRIGTVYVESDLSEVASRLRVQTLTITQTPLNGVQKTIPAGTAVELADALVDCL